jgi:hypothetical protein
LNSKEAIRHRLRQLSVEKSLPKASCGRRFLDFVQPLFHPGVLVEYRSGAGRRVVVENLSALESFLVNNFPDDAERTVWPSRVYGVASFRDSKVLQNDDPETVIVRAWKDGSLHKALRLLIGLEVTAVHDLWGLFKGLPHELKISIRIAFRPPE